MNGEGERRNQDEATPARNDSGLYRGQLWHHRTAPAHAFTRDVLLARADVTEIDAAPGGVLSLVRGWPLVLRARDHLLPESLPEEGAGLRPLATRIRELIFKTTGKTLNGALELISQPRAFGLTFDPASFVYCYEGNRIECVIAEVTNTPWGERHAYVLTGGETDAAGTLKFETPKAMHVSPFFDMDHTYSFGFKNLPERLHLSVTNRQDGQDVFRAGIGAERLAGIGAPMSQSIFRHAFMPFETLIGIYSQAARLAWKGTPFHPHPGKHRTT